jgi:DNA invertase Pin-like site-specific DNA recombinase
MDYEGIIPGVDSDKLQALQAEWSRLRPVRHPAYPPSAEDEERRLWAVTRDILDQLANYYGRMPIGGVLRFVRDGISDGLEGKPPVIFTKQAGHKRSSSRKKAQQTALAYVELAREGLIPDRTPVTTVCRYFGIKRSTWVKRFPKQLEGRDRVEIKKSLLAFEQSPELLLALARRYLQDAGNIYQMP